VPDRVPAWPASYRVTGGELLVTGLSPARVGATVGSLSHARMALDAVGRRQIEGKGHTSILLLAAPETALWWLPTTSLQCLSVPGRAKRDADARNDS